MCQGRVNQGEPSRLQWEHRILPHFVGNLWFHICNRILVPFCQDSENSAKITPKLPQNGPKITPKWHWNHPKIDTKIAPKWLRNGPEIIPEPAELTPNISIKLPQIELSQNSPRMLSAWQQNSPWTSRKLPQYCFKIAPNRLWNCFIMVPEWSQNGYKIVPELHKYC